MWLVHRLYTNCLKLPLLCLDRKLSLVFIRAQSWLTGALLRQQKIAFFTHNRFVINGDFVSHSVWMAVIVGVSYKYLEGRIKKTTKSYSFTIGDWFDAYLYHISIGTTKRNRMYLFQYVLTDHVYVETHLKDPLYCQYRIDYFNRNSEHNNSTF